MTRYLVRVPFTDPQMAGEVFYLGARLDRDLKPAVVDREHLTVGDTFESFGDAVAAAKRCGYAGAEVVGT